MEKEWTIEELERELKKLIEESHKEPKRCNGKPKAYVMIVYHYVGIAYLEKEHFAEPSLTTSAAS